MFKAIVQSKENYLNGIKVNVTFTDGVQSLTESCVPQNIDGLKYWVKSRLEQLNASPEIDSLYKDGDEVVVDEVVAPPVEKTQDEIDQEVWIAKYRYWVRIKTTVIDTGIVPITNPKVAALLADLKTTLKPEYLDVI